MIVPFVIQGNAKIQFIPQAFIHRLKPYIIIKRANHRAVVLKPYSVIIKNIITCNATQNLTDFRQPSGEFVVVAKPVIPTCVDLRVAVFSMKFTACIPNAKPAQGHFLICHIFLSALVTPGAGSLL